MGTGLIQRVTGSSPVSGASPGNMPGFVVYVLYLYFYSDVAAKYYVGYTDDPQLGTIIIKRSLHRATQKE